MDYICLKCKWEDMHHTDNNNDKAKCIMYGRQLVGIWFWWAPAHFLCPEVVKRESSRHWTCTFLFWAVHSRTWRPKVLRRWATPLTCDAKISGTWRKSNAHIQIFPKILVRSFIEPKLSTVISRPKILIYSKHFR